MIGRGAVKRLRDIAEEGEGRLRLEAGGVVIDGDVDRRATINERYDGALDVLEPTVLEGDSGVVPHIAVNDEAGWAWMALPAEIVGDGADEVPDGVDILSAVSDVGEDRSPLSTPYQHVGYVTDIVVDVTVPIHHRISISSREEQVFLHNYREDLGETRKGVKNPADYEWYPKSMRLTRYAGLGERTVRKISHQVEVVEDLLDEENGEIAEFVREAGVTRHRQLQEEVLEDFGESREQREEWEVRFVRNVSDWQDEREELADVVSEPMQSYRAEAIKEASSLRSDALRRTVYADAVVRYVAEERDVGVSEVVGGLEAADLGELIAEYGVQMFPREIDVIEVSERTLADTLSVLRYFRCS